MDGPYSQGYDFDVWGNVTHKYGWGGEVQGGTAGQSSDKYYTYTGNRRDGFGYDASGNLTNDLGQTFTYEATGQQAAASYGGYSLQQSYDGDGLRLKKNDNGGNTYYLRSSVLGGQVVAEMDSSGGLGRQYVYLGGQLLALQAPTKQGVLQTYWVHEDPITKSKRVTNNLGTVVSTIELDPWGADTPRSVDVVFQPRKFTSYERDGNGSDEAMFRRYNRWHSRFDQPDPYDGGYNAADPQSFNRYAYVQGDPVNFVDPTGLKQCIPGDISPECDSSGFGGWGGGWDFNDRGHPGRDIISAAEGAYNNFAYQYLPIDEGITLHREFQFFSIWGGIWQQKRGGGGGRLDPQAVGQELNACLEQAKTGYYERARQNEAQNSEGVFSSPGETAGGAVLGAVLSRALGLAATAGAAAAGAVVGVVATVAVKVGHNAIKGASRESGNLNAWSADVRSCYNQIKQKYGIGLYSPNSLYPWQVPLRNPASLVPGRH